MQIRLPRLFRIIFLISFSMLQQIYIFLIHCSYAFLKHADPPLPLKKSFFHFSVENDTQRSETKKKSFFRFLLLELWSTLLTIFYQPKIENKMLYQKMRSVLKLIIDFFVWFFVFEIWSILYFFFGRTLQKFEEKKRVDASHPPHPSPGAPPPCPGCFWIDTLVGTG